MNPLINLITKSSRTRHYMLPQWCNMNTKHTCEVFLPKKVDLTPINLLELTSILKKQEGERHDLKVITKK